MTDEMLITPADLGLPAKFACWRSGQPEAICRITDARARFVALSMPTGTGKSLTYVAAALLLGKRCVIVTSSKGLQNQLLRDFAEVGLVDIRGRNNYECALGKGVDCEQGADANCPHKKDAECPYYRAYLAARSSHLVLTNYSYWMLIHRYGEGLGPVELLVLDEAHDAPEEVCSVMSVHLTARQIYGMLRSSFPADGATIDVWRRWAMIEHARARSLQERLVEESLRYRLDGGPPPSLARELTSVRTLVQSLETVMLATSAWADEPVPDSGGGGYRLEPLWAAEYAKESLFCNAPQVLLISATVMLRTLDLLGIEEGERDFLELPSSFPPDLGPVYFIPTVRVWHRWGELDEALWLQRLDEICWTRRDRRGIIHTVSYTRAGLIRERSRMGNCMLTHQPGSAAAVEQIEHFIHKPPPAILLSPAITTGYDFPYEAAEFQVLAKLPFLDTTSRIAQARSGRRYKPNTPERRRGERYADYMVAVAVVQTCGRIRRAEDDQGETFLIDNNWKWFYRRVQGMLPFWFRRLVRYRRDLPAPLPKLARRSRPNNDSN